MQIEPVGHLNATIVERGIEIYPGTGVRLTYQNFGSSWIGILRGSTEQIELVFNGLYNFGATEGELDFKDGAHTVAIFWTSPEQLENFFFNKEFIRRTGTTEDKGKRGGSVAASEAYAQAQIAALREGCHEEIMKFGRKSMPEVYTMGKVGAERPDGDFKSAVLNYAFSANRGE